MKKPLIFFALVAILFINACKPAASDPENANANLVLKGTIDVKTAKRLVKNFEPRTFRKKDVLGFNDTRCVWFSVGQLDSLIQKIKREKGDGVRFYLAAYDKDRAVQNDTLFRDHTTLVMVSTVRDSSRGKHVDYFSDKANGTKGAIITATPENRGEICPPPSNCSADGASLLEQ
jgi:hypothetical protein